VNPVTGKLEMAKADMTKSKYSYGLNFKDIPDYEKQAQEKDTPLQSLVKKFESYGYTVEQAFHLFDEDGNGLLTCKEIKDGIRD
jgi:N-acetyl-anhydromuramyl-L-alanine amidase AmpD